MNKIAILLDDKIESFYWIGFLLADGHFNPSKGFLCLSLSNIDRKHLIKFYKFIKCSNKISNHKRNMSGFRAFDKKTISEICLKFDINQRKTYNSPNIDFYKEFNNNLFLALLIGFIDGDGHIKKVWKRNDCSITIKLHSSWIKLLKLFGERLSLACETKIPPPKINNAGYAFIHFSNRKVIRFLKEFGIKHKLPSLKRKWRLIDKKAMAHSNTDTEEISLKMIKSGADREEICKALNIHKDRLGKILCKNNIRLHPKRFFDKKDNLSLKPKALNMLSVGIKPMEVSKKLDIPINNVYNLVKYHNL